MRAQQVSKAYAHLELSPGATRSQIERAFRGQLRQYHPDRHMGDGESHPSAVALAVSLTDAYLLLIQR
jgi:curved DNA-binding protein CbpA